MSIMRCDRHGSWDSDLHEECELCTLNAEDSSDFRKAAGEFERMTAYRVEKEHSEWNAAIEEAAAFVEHYDQYLANTVRSLKRRSNEEIDSHGK